MTRTCFTHFSIYGYISTYPRYSSRYRWSWTTVVNSVIGSQLNVTRAYVARSLCPSLRGSSQLVGSELSSIALLVCVLCLWPLRLPACQRPISAWFCLQCYYEWGTLLTRFALIRDDTPLNASKPRRSFPLLSPFFFSPHLNSNGMFWPDDGSQDGHEYWPVAARMASKLHSTSKRRF